MIVPFKPVYLPKMYKKPQYIIIHDFSCQFGTIDKARTDNKLANIQGVRAYNWVFNGEYELPYHFVCEKINQDYETLMARPFCYMCEYEDIPSQYVASIHIAVAGNYNFMTMTNRAYQQMAYRSISSIVKWFRLPLNRVLMHWEVSENKNLHCPGDNFDKDRFKFTMKQYSLMQK